MPKKVISGRIFDVLNVAGLGQLDQAIPFEKLKSKKPDYALEDNGMMSIKWREGNKKKCVLLGVSIIKHLELEPEEIEQT